MKKLSLLFGTVAALIAAPVLAAPAPGGARANPDADNNGVLTRAEVEADVTTRFAKLDANKDGKVDEGDRAAHRKAKADAMFAAADTDRNGSISRAEFDAAGEARQAKRAERRAAMAERRGGGDHGHGFHGKRGGRGGERLLAMVDSNGDKAVTAAEMRTAALARFDRIDANKDGQVTAEERAAMCGQRGEGRRGEGRRGGAGAPTPEG
jgi:Ca2+-binding EF-hand superfamily protein